MRNEMQKDKACRYMRHLGLMPSIIRDFEKNDTLYYSEYSQLGGILYWADNEPEWMKKIRDWEEQSGNMAYHALHFALKHGVEMLAVLYTGHREEENDAEQSSVENNIPWCYTFNLTYPELSEYGSIAVREAAGGLVPWK